MTKNFIKSEPASYFYNIIFMGYKRETFYKSPGIAGKHKYCSTVITRKTILYPKYDNKIYIVRKNGLHYSYINLPNGKKYYCDSSASKPQHMTCGSISESYYACVIFNGHKVTRCARVIYSNGAKRYLKNWLINNAGSIF